MYLVIELPDVLLYVGEEAPEGKLLQELPDVVMVVQREAVPVGPRGGQGRGPGCGGAPGGQDPEAVQTPAGRAVQLERVTLHAVGHLV